MGNYYVQLLLLIGLSSEVCKASDQELHYHEVCFLTAHNAYAAHDHDFSYAQQAVTLQEQLSLGVRGFMLDTHVDSKGRVALCHGNERITKLIRRGKEPLLFHKELCVFSSFLKEHTDQIITIFLENYVDNKKLIDDAFKEAKLDPYILAPQDWDPDKEEGWPTLEWMKSHNKRLIIFNSLGETELTYHQWAHIAENQWGTVVPRRACFERKESYRYRSNKRYLYVLNFFPSFRFNPGGSYHRINTSLLKTFLDSALKGLNGTAYGRNRFPNFISIDFVNEGTAMEHVRTYNEYSTKAKRFFFRPLEQHEQ